MLAIFTTRYSDTVQIPVFYFRLYTILSINIVNNPFNFSVRDCLSELSINSFEYGVTTVTTSPLVSILYTGDICFVLENVRTRVLLYAHEI